MARGCGLDRGFHWLVAITTSSDLRFTSEKDYQDGRRRRQGLYALLQRGEYYEASFEEQHHISGACQLNKNVACLSRRCLLLATTPPLPGMKQNTHRRKLAIYGAELAHTVYFLLCYGTHLLCYPFDSHSVSTGTLRRLA